MANQKKSTKVQNVIFHVCVGKPRPTDCDDFGTARDLTDIISHSKYFIDRFMGFGLTRGQSTLHTGLGHCT